MVRVRFLSAVQDLVLQAPVLKQTQQLHGVLKSSLLQRLHNSLFSSSAGACGFPGAAAVAVQGSTFSTLQQHLQPHHQCHHHHQQRQQQQQQLLGSPSCWQQSRSYARAFRTGQRSDRGGPQQDRYQQQHQQQPRVELSQLRLGRHIRNCVPTETFRQPADDDQQEQYDPFKDRDPLLINPRQVDGERTAVLEEPLLLRQQLEGSALPNEFKRSHFISPFWDEVLLDVNRTVQVTKGGKVETLHALVVVGNHEGLIGIGQHSGKNIQKVCLDAQLKAYQNLVAIPRYRGHTVYHPIDITVRKVRMQVWPRPLGFGVTANPVVTELCDLAGLDNVTVKVSGNRKNLRNLVQVFVEAMSNQSLPHDGVEGSGVYMREVYAKKLPCGLQRGVDVP